MRSECSETRRPISMSTSLLYHACGIRGYTLTKTEFDGGIELFHVEPQPPQCRSSRLSL